MGVPGLKKFLEKHVPGCFIKMHIERFAGKTVAIDANLYVYRFQEASPRDWPNRLFCMISFLKEYFINPILVSDGPRRPEKLETSLKRRKDYQKRVEIVKQLKKDFKVYKKTKKISERLQQLSKKILSKNQSMFSTEYFDEIGVKKYINDKLLIAANRGENKISHQGMF